MAVLCSYVLAHFLHVLGDTLEDYSSSAGLIATSFSC